MNWFKHDADASGDAKVKKLLLKYGAVGYAVYFHCVELIAGDISETNLTFELEHDSEIIADNLKIKGTAEQSGIEIVEEVMRYIISLGLFESSGNRIFCTKLLKRLDTSMTSNARFRTMITAAKEGHDAIMIPSCKKRREEIRREENIQDEIDVKEVDKKHKYGEYHHVLLTDSEYNRLLDEWGESELQYMITVLDEGIELKGYKYKNHLLALRNWKKKEDERRKKERGPGYKTIVVPEHLKGIADVNCRE